jgi:carbonic anhydrase/acetyltransferase-like protein (isoleucine patch superfamily)
MIREFNNKSPRIALSAFVSETAYVIGDVEIGENANIWPGAVIRGDFAKITIGQNTSIEDNCVVHGGADITIGDNVIVGHGAVIHCHKIGNNALIGINATILDGAEVGDFSMVAAGSLVTPNMKIPSKSMVMGSPAKIKGRLSPEQLNYLTNGPSLNLKLAQEYKKQGL